MNEDSFLAGLRQRLPVASADVVIGPGDDCAAITGADHDLLLLALDQIVGGRHYFEQDDKGSAATAPELVGRKLLARNLSDIAAMGGTPLFCLVGCALSPRLTHTDDWLNRFFDGLLELAGEYQVQLIGGDLAASRQDDVGSLTIVGSVPADQVCRRSGARPGDLLFVTGQFGDSVNTGHHLHFQPRCREGRWLAEQKMARAMIDVSDGLLLDGLRLGQASNIGLQIDLTTVPLRNPERKVKLAISDGEDYELLFAVAPEKAGRLTESWPFAGTPLARIGTAVQNETPEIIDQQGRSLTRNGQMGYDHYSVDD